MYDSLFKTYSEQWGYNNKSVQNVARLLASAIERDNQLNAEESKEYKRAATELEFGAGFFERAHP